MAGWRAQRFAQGADFQQLLNLLEKVPRKVSGPISRSAVRGAATVVKNEIVSVVPVDEAILKASQGTKVKMFRQGAMGWVGASVEKMKTLQSPTHVQPRPVNIDYLANYGHVAGISTHPLAPPPGTFVPGAHYMEQAETQSAPAARQKMTDLMRKGILRAMVRGTI